MKKFFRQNVSNLVSMERYESPGSKSQYNHGLEMYSKKTTDTQRQVPLEHHFQDLTSVSHIAFILLQSFGAFWRVLEPLGEFQSNWDNFVSFVIVSKHLGGCCSI